MITPEPQSSSEGKVILSLNATDRILFIDATGPFDEVFAQEYVRQIMPFREALKPIAWGSLATLKGGENLLTPQTRDFLITSIKGARQLGLVVTSLVLEKDASEKEKAFWHKLYTETGLSYGLFEDKHLAMSFLTLELQRCR